MTVTEEINSIAEASSAILGHEPPSVPLPSLGEGTSVQIKPFPWPGFKRQWAAFVKSFGPLLIDIARQFPQLAGQAGIELPPVEGADDVAEDAADAAMAGKIVTLLMNYLPQIEDAPAFMEKLILDHGCLDAQQVSQLSAAEALQLFAACLTSLVLAFAEVRRFLPVAMRAAAAAWNDAAATATATG